MSRNLRVSIRVLLFLASLALFLAGLAVGLQYDPDWSIPLFAAAFALTGFNFWWTLRVLRIDNNG